MRTATFGGSGARKDRDAAAFRRPVERLRAALVSELEAEHGLSREEAEAAVVLGAYLDDVLVIDIGAGTVDLCRMHGTMPEEADQLTLECGGDFIDAAFTERLQRSCEGATFSARMVKEAKERYASVADAMEPAVVNLPVNGKPTPFDVTNDLREACRLIVPPIVDGLGKLIASFDPEFQDRLKNRVLLAGGGSQIRGLDTAIEAHMHEELGGGKVQLIEEPMYGGANGALKIAHDMPAEYWEQLK